jgi:hypothetical protein
MNGTVSRSRAVLCVAALTLCAAWIGATLVSASSPIIVVRTYNTYGVSPGELQTAARTLHGLMSAVSIAIRWRTCRVVGRAPTADPCADPVSADEIVVRLVESTGVQTESTTLGDAFVDPVLKSGSMATIYVDRVEALSHAVDVDRGLLLGRAVAHELGHLLLGTPLHSGFGLMRGYWSVRTIVDNQTSDWVFSHDQGVIMQAAVATRMRTAARLTASR